MGQVSVTIYGKVYRMACGDGEEEHLEALAGEYDQRIGQLQSSFGSIGDMRLHVMAALTVLDELHETRKTVAGLKDEVARLKTAVEAGAEQGDALEARAARAVVEAAERVERLAKSLNPSSGAA